MQPSIFKRCLCYIVLYLVSSSIVGCVASDLAAVSPSEQPIDYFNKNLKSNFVLKPHSDISFQADHIAFNSKLNLVIATGNIVIIQDKQTIKADKAYIQKDKNFIYATGNIYIKDINNNEFFADEIEIKDTLNNVIINNLKILFTDKSLLTSEKIVRTNDVLTTYNSAYTACSFSKYLTPFWSIRAKKITYNQKSHNITIYNGWLQIKEIPVLWIPYVRYGDPQVHRKFGLLTPTVGHNSVLGYYYTQPVFFPINIHTDLTLTTTFYKKRFPLLHSSSNVKHDYPPLLQAHLSSFIPNGEVDLKASFTPNEEKDWAIFTYYRHDWSDIFRFTVNVNDASSRQFLTLYDINHYTSKESFLDINTNLEAFFNQNNYLKISLEGTRNINNMFSRADNPYILPQIDFTHYGDNHSYGKVDLMIKYYNLVSADLLPDDHHDNEVQNFDLQKLILSLRHHISRPLTIGVFSLNTHLQNVNYYKIFLDHTKGGTSNIFDRYLGGSIAAKFEYPIYSNWRSYNSIINPIIQFAHSNMIFNKKFDLSHWENNTIDINILNLFENNKFSGFDRYSRGNRLNYGLQWDLINNEGFNGHMLIGQSLYLSKNEESSYLAYIALRPFPFLNLSYRTTLDSNLKHFDQTNINLFLGNNLIGTHLSYRSLANLDPNIYNSTSLEEVQHALHVQLSQRLLLTTIATFNLENKYNTTLKHLESFDAILTWQNECFSFAVKVARKFYGNTDVHPNYSYQFALMLKNLGGSHNRFIKKTRLNSFFYLN